MKTSKSIILALPPLAAGFFFGFFVGFSGSEDGEFLLKYRQAQEDYNQLNQRFLRMRLERENLIGQVRTLEKIVETQNAEIEEINAVIDRPPSG